MSGILEGKDGYFSGRVHRICVGLGEIHCLKSFSLVLPHDNLSVYPRLNSLEASRYNAKVKLFDTFKRTGFRAAARSESYFSYLNRTARPELSLVRELLEVWFSRFPTQCKAEFRVRFRSRDNWNHSAAFFELFLHELLMCLEFSVVPHPMVPGTANTPDFLVTCPAGGRFYLEATTCSNKSRKDRGEEARERAVYDAINKLESPEFFLWVETYAVGPAQISGDRVHTFIRQKLETINPDQITALTASDGVRGLPEWQFEEYGWRIGIRPIPKSRKARGKPGIRPIGVSGPGEARWIQSHVALRQSIVRKAGRYGAELSAPYLIAVNMLCDYWQGDRIDEMQALFGQESYIFDLDDISRKAEMKRYCDGAWTSLGGPRYTRNSAVLILNHLLPWTVGTARACLYHNPWAKFPLDGLLTRLPQAVAASSKMTWIDGVECWKLLGLPDKWPFHQRQK